MLTAADKRELDQLFAELAQVKAFALAVALDDSATDGQRYEAWQQLQHAHDVILIWIAKIKSDLDEDD